MKIEFNNRVELQRKVLKIVNKIYPESQLTGLSKPALENWILINKINDISLKDKLYNISEKLFFIANKSQDQITEEYQNLQSNIQNDINQLNKFIK
jgi:hypothetical protein